MEIILQERILLCIKEKRMEELKKLLAEAELIEILHAFHELSDEEQVIVFRLLNKDTALLLFEELDTDEQHNLIRSFTDEHTIELMEELAPDDRVKLLDELPASVAKKLINSLSAEERNVTNVLLGYESQTAGRIMTTEYISLRRNMTVDQALEKVRKQAKEKETIYTLYVTSNSKKLEGVLSLKDLLMADGHVKVEDVMSKKPIYVSTDTDQEEVAGVLKEMDLLAIPVVDKEDRLVGIVTIDDAVDILEEEATEDMLDQAGITGNEADRSEVLVNGNLLSIWRVRLPILLITLGFALFSGWIIGGFEDTLESIPMVAVFIPLLMGMSGNVGTQSSTVFARGVVLGHIQMKNFAKPFLKEIGIGFSMGAVLGIVTGIIAAIWALILDGTPLLGLAVGLSLTVAMTLAALLGFFVPFVLIKFNVDQAAGSAPIITSIKDIAGLLIYFVSVSVFMGHLI